MSNGGLDAMIGLVPLAIGAGIVAGVTERFLGPTSPRRRRKRMDYGEMHYGGGNPYGLSPYGQRKPQGLPRKPGSFRASKRIARGQTPGNKPMVTKRFREAPSGRASTGLENSPIFRAGANMGREFRGIGKGYSARDLKQKFANPYR